MKCRGLIKAHINGGLGNQLFQISNALNLAYLSQNPVTFIDIGAKEPSIIEDIFDFKFNLNYEFNGVNLLSVPVQDHTHCSFYRFKEKNSYFEKIDLGYSHISIYGYFQSVLYFREIEKYLRDLILKYNIQPRLQRDIAVHVRLGDYLNRKNRKIYIQQPVEYYSKGIELLVKKYNIQSPKIAFFTNDKKEFESKYLEKFEKYDSEISPLNTLESFKNLLLFQNIVISNSTFSWWAAWVCQASTVAPLNWYSKRSGLLFDDNNFNLTNWARI
jgi:hypothetical protein